MVDNSAFSSLIADIAMPQRESKGFMAADGVTKLRGYLMLPNDFDVSQKYPVLMYYYGGPNSQEVSNRWSLGHWSYHSFLVSNFGFIVAVVDNRGTCCMGQQFLKSTYKQLGVLETEDQLAVASQLASLPYVDGNRIASWGWSFGGFLTCRLASSSPSQSNISASASVAAVTDWQFYDSIYTERYMQTPDLNPEGYDASTVIGRASAVVRPHFIIHGTGDDNVHFQNSADWVTDLVNSGASSFQVMYYPDKAHGLSGTSTQKHLYYSLTKFFCSNLNVTCDLPIIGPIENSSVTKRSFFHSKRSDNKNSKVGGMVGEEVSLFGGFQHRRVPLSPKTKTLF